MVTPSGATYAIDGGTRAGGNLFHSFSQFDLGAGDTARWVRSGGDGGSIANVISRVTGGQASHISGTIDSTALPNASFYFVNPAGIVFGAGAVLNVPSAAHFSTASELRFADGGRFAVATRNGSTLSVAAPEAWGFVGGQGAIDIQGAGAAFMAQPNPLSFMASDVTITDSRLSTAGLDIIAVGNGAATVRFADPLAGDYGGLLRARGSTLNVAAVDATAGPIRLGGGFIDLETTFVVTDTVGLAVGSDLVLAGDRIRIGRDAVVISSSRGPAAGGRVIANAREIEVDGTGGSVTVTTGLTSVATGDGAAGAIALTAKDLLLLKGGAFVGSTVTGAGDAADVALSATNLVIDSAIIASSTFAAGDGGDIRLSGDAMDLGAATVFTSAFGAGRGGDVFLDGRVLVMSGGSLGSVPGGVGDSGNLFITLTGRLETDGSAFQVSSFSANTAGVITVRAPEVFMRASRISTGAAADGGPGRVLIETSSLIFDEVIMGGDAKDGVGIQPGLIRLRSTGDVFMRNTTIFSNAFGLADGGTVAIEGRDVTLLNTDIQSDTFSLGGAGQVSVKADTLHLTNAHISSGTNGEGAGGNVTLTARAIALDTESSVSSDTFFSGDAGQVTVTAQSLDLRDISRISSDANSGTGNADRVVIEVGRLTMTDAVISSTAFSLGDAGSVEIRADEIDLDGEQRGFTAIASETLSLGSGGDVIIDARKITLKGSALISSTGYAEGHAGDVTIRTDELSLLTGGDIASNSLGNGDAGDIAITAKKILVQSADGFDSVISSGAFGASGEGGDITLETGSLVVDAGGISSDAFAGAGDAGDVRIKADTITLKNPGGVSSSTNDFGNAGSVTIDTKSLTLKAGAVILSVATTVSNGDAGKVSITANDIAVGQDASITTATFGRGNAGALDITTKSLRVDGGQVSSSAEGDATGMASQVRITADRLDVVNGGGVSTLSVNPNKAGEIDITAGDVRVDGARSFISSANLADGSGDAGEIFLRADNVTLSNGGRITTNSVAGAAGDIEVRIERPGLFILEGADAPGIIQTSSGPGTGGRITISDPLAIISNGGLIQALGQQRGANVVIQSRYFIESTDRLNAVQVDGEFQIQTGLYDVSSGTVSRDLSVLDASKVLRGQCPAARSTGAVSQLITRPVGPYAREPVTDVLRASPPGGCP